MVLIINVFVSIYSIWHIRRSLGIEGMPLIFKDSLKENTVLYGIRYVY